MVTQVGQCGTEDPKDAGSHTSIEWVRMAKKLGTAQLVDSWTEEIMNPSLWELVIYPIFRSSYLAYPSGACKKIKECV